MVMQYYSQYGQDEFLDQKVFKQKKNGFFVEVGVCDAIRLSNTYFLENVRNWTGLCIEPNPIQYAKLLMTTMNPLNIIQQLILNPNADPLQTT